MKPEYIDNFLGKKEFDELQKLLMSSEMPWYYCPGIDYKDDENKFQFFYIFYDPYYPFLLFDKLEPIISTIIPTAIIRIKANLITRTPKIVENEYHHDIPLYDDKNKKPTEKLKQLTTAIFYVNTNNGYTKFEDGTKIESVANRMLFFSTDMDHTGTSCTDEKTRVIINFNYFK
jgi:hypothetical protein